MARIDLFVLKEVEYDTEALFRRHRIQIDSGRFLAVLTPEDAVLSKLRWFKDDNEMDSKQLQDVVDYCGSAGPTRC